LKIDTEGYEIEVLKGGHDFLKKQNIDFIYAEVGFELDDKQHTNWNKLIDFMHSYSYRFAGFFESVYNNKSTLIYSNALFASSRFK
jgi:hypothetical protein